MCNSLFELYLLAVVFNFLVSSGICVEMVRDGEMRRENLLSGAVGGAGPAPRHDGHGPGLGHGRDRGRDHVDGH